MNHEVLVIDDDRAFRQTLSAALKRKGFSVRAAPSGQAGLEETAQRAPDVVILDFMMPGMNGIEVCQALKQDPATAGIPILILTGNDKEGLEVSCLDMGADDYLIKPVEQDRLLARLNALLRRSHLRSIAAQEPIKLGTLELDYERKLAAWKGRRYLHLTPKEFGLLYELANASPRPLDRATLYRDVWGPEPPSDNALKTVEVHVRRIRLKMGWKADQWLLTVSGRGYCLIPS